MIDTDKYEGHTPAPWTPTDDGHIDADYGIAQVLPFVSPMAFSANAQLIADAPDLLEEVKRLRRVIGQLQEAYSRDELQDMFDVFCDLVGLDEEGDAEEYAEAWDEWRNEE